MPEKITVREYFEKENIDLNCLEEMEDGSPYWESCLNFVTENWNRLTTTMSEKQVDWLSRIQDDCIERRIERRAH